MARKDESFEKRLARLKEIVDVLERGDSPLEEGLALFKEGLTLAKACGKQLEAARNEVKLVSGGLLEDFEAPEGEDHEG